MVGGSSAILAVGQRLEQRYGRRPRIIDPHLCVAVGAALKASTVASYSAYLALDPLPPTTPLVKIDIGGAVLAGPELADPARASVRLASEDGLYQRETATTAEGRFHFADVPLVEDGARSFTLSVGDGRAPVETRKLELVHTFEDAPPPVEADGTDILAHDVGIFVVGGQHVVAPAGTVLPFQPETVQLRRVSERDRVEVKLFEGNQPIGEVVVRHLPPSLPVGAAVLIDLVFNGDWTIDAHARIPDAGEGATASATIEIPPVDVDSWSDLRAAYTRAVAAWLEKREVGRAADKVRSGPRIEELLAQIDRLLNEGRDRVHAHHLLREVETLIGSIGIEGANGLRPPLEEFEDALRELDGLIARAKDKDPGCARGHEEARPTLEAVGRGAYEARNATDWRIANEQVQNRIAVIERCLGEITNGDPPAFLMAMELVRRLSELEKAIELLGNETGDGARAAQLHEAARTCAAKVQGVDLSADNSVAVQQLRTVYHSSIQPLELQVDRWAKEQGDLGPKLDIALGDWTPPGGHSVVRGGKAPH
jgi:hypothetical protein